jgi:hypothetical protein
MLNQVVMKIKFILFLILLFTLSCHKTKEYDPTSPQNLIGDWMWIKSTGGIAGMTYTPESTGETRKISFSANWIFKTYIDGVLTFEEPFKTDSRSLDNSGIVYQVILLNENPFQSYRFSSPDSLILNDFMADGFTGFYKRVK